ncbi:MAG TPA: T9SS type A sorting domain-containing protein, partial [Pseudobacter sp.]|nr:T9SS type A sorting domain-containing protein [Pseudobacter sp.]
FKNSEFEDYKTLTNQPSLTLDELKITHYSGNGEDCDFANNTNQGVMVNPVQVKEFTTEGFYVEVSISHFSEFGSVGGSEILPVSLTQFRAVPAGEAVQLNWTTAQELNNKGFEILRSKDGVQFEKIGWVDGNGTTSTAQRYTFKDNAPFAGRNFYRLRQLDIDNTPALSDIAAVTLKKAISLSIAPNPVDNTLYIGFDEKNTTSVRILDLQGRVQWKSSGQSTSSLLTVPVQYLTKGIYMVEVTDKQGNRQVERFIKK